jgi:hypothetical protein
VKILTANDLATGDVVWWAGDGWSRLLVEAIDTGDKGEEIGKHEEIARHVVAAYVVDGEMTADGPRPAHIKERIRASAPPSART